MGNSQIIYNREYVYFYSFVLLCRWSLLRLLRRRVQVKSVSAGGYGYIRRFCRDEKQTTAAALRPALQTRRPGGYVASVGSKFLSLWLLNAVSRGDLGGVGGQSGVGGRGGDGHAGGGAGQSQKGDGLHPQQAGQRHGTVRVAQHVSWGQRAHGGQGGCGGGGRGGWLGEGHVEVDGSGHASRLGRGFGCLQTAKERRERWTRTGLGDYAVAATLWELSLSVFFSSTRIIFERKKRRLSG